MSSRECVFTVCVGRSSAGFRVQLEMDTANHMGLLLTPPPSPPHLSIQSTDINTDLYSFTRRELQHGEREEREGSERTGKDRAYQIAVFLGLLFVLFCFWFCRIHSGKQRQFETKGPFSEQLSFVIINHLCTK